MFFNKNYKGAKKLPGVSKDEEELPKLGEPSKLKKKKKYGKIQPIFFKLLTTYGGLSEKKKNFPLKKLKLYLFKINYR